MTAAMADRMGLKSTTLLVAVTFHSPPPGSSQYEAGFQFESNRSARCWLGGRGDSGFAVVHGNVASVVVRRSLPFRTIALAGCAGAGSAERGPRPLVTTDMNCNNFARAALYNQLEVAHLTFTLVQTHEFVDAPNTRGTTLHASRQGIPTSHSLPRQVPTIRRCTAKCRTFVHGHQEERHSHHVRVGDGRARTQCFLCERGGTH